jgi:protein-tyrosine phosphatase
MFDRVLVVCVGNICRSPMAEALLRARLGRRPRFEVSSAGVSALVGHPAADAAVALMREREIDISGHRARQVTPQLVSESDLVLVMETGHERAVLEIAPRARGKVHRIGRFGNFDVPDPHRLPRAAFAEALQLIERGVADYERAFWPPVLRKVHG